MAFRIPIYQPDLNGNEVNYVGECLRSGWISSRGKFVQRFEQSFSEYLGVPYCASVCNGTAALQTALGALGIGTGDEVIVPTFTYIASVSTIVGAGATPVLVDCLPDTWQMDPQSVQFKLTPRTKAIVVVHLYGGVCMMERIMDIASENGLFVIEDCAEAMGARLNGRLTGTFGDVSTFSFYGNKTITTGEGGMVVTCNHSLYEKAWKYKSQGVVRGRDYWHDSIGFNYRMNNICAAIGLAQLERIEEFLEKKRLIEAWYREELAESQVVFQEEGPGVHSSFWMVSILLPHSSAVEALRRALADAEIETRPLFSPIHLMPMLDDKGPFPVAQNISARGLNLPSWPGLTRRDIASVCDTIKRFFESGKKGFSGR